MKSLFGLLVLCLLAVTLTRAAPGFPQPVPLNAPILAADTAEQDAIILYDVSAGTERVLNFGDGLHRVWGFTPDGCRVVLTLADGAALARLYTARLDGGDLRELVTYEPVGGGEWGVWEPGVQPNGDRIAFTLVSRDAAGELQHHVAWVNVDGGTAETYSVSGDEHTARWSPDGAWLAYVSYETAPPVEGSTTVVREADLWVVSADGQTKHRLTTFISGSVSMPRWSPDGDLIGFVYSPSANNDQFWMIGNAPDALPTQLSFQPALALDLTWLPNSTAMIAAARDMQGVAENRLWNIPLVGNADTDAVQLALDPALTYVDYPRFSPDGSLLALRSAYALALVNSADGTLVWLDETRPGNTPPVWSPAEFAGEAACG